VSVTVPKLRPSLRSSAPGIRYEQALWSQGASAVVGLDEVGRGAWAGPLTVGAVVVPKDHRLYKVRDSKQLTEGERDALIDRIKDWSTAWAVGHASPRECDDLGMSEAQRLAAQRAITGLGIDVDHALVDGNWDFVETIPVTTIVRGDSISTSIAAASIVAKVTRDRIMRTEAASLPWYSFDSNKGYPCHRHRGALRVMGPSVIHRTSWSFMTDLVWDGIPECRCDPVQHGLF
jgi:ribonuclease HII